MGRSIPSFRILIDIERLEWKMFKERLSNRKDKYSFNKLFSIPKLHCHSLSNLSRPVIIEPILLSTLFYNFKEVSKISDKSTTPAKKEKNLNVGVRNNVETPLSDFLPRTNEEEWYKNYNFARILEDWKEFSDCLSKEDESVFIEMIASCYDNYHLSINSFDSNNSSSRNQKIKSSKIEKSGSQVTRSASLFMALFLYQQKQLEQIKSNQRFLDYYS